MRGFRHFPQFGQGEIMKLFRASAFAAGMVLAVFTADITLSAAAETAPKGAEAGPAVSAGPDVVVQEAAGDAAKDKKKVVVKRKKGRRKGAPKKDQVTETYPIPGEKLTLKQVMDILKTTKNLSGKNLSGLQLVGVDFARCNLKGVDLSHANLERADLGESNLERAELTGANLKMANLRLSGMTGANLDRAILDGAVWKDGRVCPSGSIGQCKEFSASYASR